MEKAKEAVSDFMSKSGKHDTTVHEKVAPAVTHETRLPTQHENVQTAVDKEIHQDHHHTSVQPVADKKVLPEEHSHNLVGVEHRHFEHGDSNDTESRLAAEAARFKNERVVEDTQHTHSVAPVVAGEHIHHHVHETIQPVVQREVVQPSVVHTTVPVHEVHHNATQHHTTSALPAVSMADFKKQGGVLSGREERSDAFKGEPKSVGGTLSSSADQYASGGTGHHHHHHHHNAGAGGVGTGTTGTTGNTGLTGNTGSSGLTGNNTGNTGLTGNTRDSGLAGSNTGNSGLTGNTRGSGLTDNTTGTTGNTGVEGTGVKPSLKDRMNPKVDADGDGKRGVLD